MWWWVFGSPFLRLVVVGASLAFGLLGGGGGGICWAAFRCLGALPGRILGAAGFWWVFPVGVWMGVGAWWRCFFGVAFVLLGGGGGGGGVGCVCMP